MWRLRILILLGALPLATVQAETSRWGAFELLGARLQPGSTARLYWRGLQSCSGGAARD